MSTKLAVRRAEQSLMTVEQLLAFTETRPDGEHWELIEGQPVLNPSPTDWHQILAANICAALVRIKRGQPAEAPVSWTPMLGVGTRVRLPKPSLPQPDVLVIAGGPGRKPTHIITRALITFEVRSRSNTKRDQAWRRRAYSSIDSCMHYVTIDQCALDVKRYDRDNDWQPEVLSDAGDALILPTLGSGAAIELREIYQFTPLVS